VNLVFVLLLAVYVMHSLAMHRQEGPETAPQDTQIHRGMSAPLMPITLFLACQIFSTPFIMSLLQRPAVWVVFGALILFALFSQLKKNTAGGAGRLEAYYYISGGLLQTGLLGLGCYIGFVDGVLGRSLFDPEWVILGLVAGHIVFGISLIFSHRSLDTLGDIAAYALDPRPFGRFVGHSPHQVFACLDVSLIEELIYRVAAQGVLLAMTGSPWIAIGVTALLFSMVNRHFFYNHVVDSLEFLAFSLLLGVLYHVTGSFMLVVMIHMVRNIEIVYFDHATRPDTASGWRLTSEKAS
jgi:membrane protease YdiL (CAAX protease family)